MSEQQKENLKESFEVYTEFLCNEITKIKSFYKVYYGLEEKLRGEEMIEVFKILDNQTCLGFGKVCP